MGRRKTVSKDESEGDGSKRKRTSFSKPKEDEVKQAKEKAAEISKPKAPGNSGDGTVHPLLIPHIAENIFKHIICPKTDDEDEGSAKSVSKNVQNLRLVCKQWKDTATRLYRRNRAPMMEFGETVWVWAWQREPVLSKAPDEKMKRFLDVMKDSNLIPIQRYTINKSCFVKENEQLMKDFMRICGPIAADLHLFCFNSNTIKFTRRTFPDLNLMNLKSLTLDCEYSRNSYIRNLIEVLLKTAEVLQKFSFTFHYYLDDDSGEELTLVERFGELICKGIPKTVKILRLDMPLSDFNLNILTESELKLEEFDVQSSVASRKLIRKFFEKQAATLKYLKIFYRDGGPSSSGSFDFPRFHELLHLELLQKVPIQKFSWEDTFPILATLNIASLWTESDCVELLSSAEKGLSLNEIHLPSRFPRSSLVKKAVQCFPNISKLHISPSSRDISEIFQEVFVYLPNIEELYVEFSCRSTDGNADSIFTGVSEEDCQRIKERGSFNNVDLVDVQQQPSILNLTSLKKLVLKDCYQVILTDFTAHFALLKMNSLKELHSHRFQMSTEYLGLLRKKFSLKLDKCWRCAESRL